MIEVVFGLLFIFVTMMYIIVIKNSKYRLLSTAWDLIVLMFISGFTLFSRTNLSRATAILIPFSSWASILLFPWESHAKYVFRSLFGNILLFVPLGLGLSKKEGWTYKYLLPFLFSIIIETIQYFTRFGVFEVDDLICNTIGGILGYEMGKQISGVRKGNFILPCIYVVSLGLCCLKSILLN